MLNQIKSVLGEFGYKVYYGRSLAKEDDEWNYFVFNKTTTKNNTDMVVEICTIEFTKAKKGCEL